MSLRRLSFLSAFTLTAALSFGNIQRDTNVSPFTSEEQAQGYRNGRVLVKLREGVAKEADANRQAMETRAGVGSRRGFSHLRRQQVLEFDSTRSVPAMMKELRTSGLYEFVEPDRIVHALTTPNDPLFPQQWSLGNTGQAGGTAGADISAAAAWTTINSAPNVIVAVIDTGVRLSHADLSGNLWNNTDGTHGFNSVTGTNVPNDDDANGHGSHVSGIIGAAGNNSTLISGVTWKTQIMACKFLDSSGSGTLSDELACFNFAIAHKAVVINGSFGTNGFSASEFTGFQQLQAANIIAVIAAGNDGLSVESDAAYPAGYLLDNIVTVAATTRTDGLAGYSNFSAGLVDLGAPGDQILSTINTSDTATGILSGTSMAAPHVTGAIALLKAQFPNDTYRQTINRLLRATTRIASLNGRVQTGGRLNLAAAVTSTDNRPFNDDFASRAQLSGGSVSVRSSNVGATAEAGEPAIFPGNTPSHSLWWSWTATATTLVGCDTTSSSYDSAIAVYTGTSLGGLTPVAATDPSAVGNAAHRVTFAATAGTTYQIAIDGRAGANGQTVMKLGAVPPNDNFASAQSVSDAPFVLHGSTSNASSETGEANPAGNSAGHSVWYKWTAPATARYQLAAFSTQADMIAGIFTGTTLANLSLVAFNDNSVPFNSDSLVTFNATAGQSYFFQIDSTTSSPDGGDFILSINDSLWQFPTGDMVTSSPAVASDGTVVVGSNDGFVYAVNPSGSEKWERALTDSVDGASPAVGPDGTVYIGANDQFLYALDGGTGVRKWRFAATSQISSAPAVAADGTIYFRDDTTLYALTPGATSPTKKWSFTITGPTYSSPAIGIDGTVYVGGTSGFFYAINPDGTQKWKFSANGDIYTSPAIAGDGTIYFGTLAGTLFALNPNGTQKWAFTVPGGNSFTSSPALGVDGTIYFGAYDNKLYAVTSSGAQKWTFTVGDQVRASSPVVGADGTIYFGDYDHRVYAVTSAGALLRTYPTADIIRSSPVIAGGNLYFASSDAKLYAFAIGQNAAASAWPMFHQNSLHTGFAGSSTIGISGQPQSQSITPGAALSLSVTATGTGPFTYQWFKDGSAIAGATAAAYSVGGASAANAGSYTVVVTGPTGSVTSAAAVVTVAANNASRLSNLSARAQVGTGANVLIAGFVVSGGSKQILVRGIGPGLNSTFGLTGFLATPTLSLFDGQSNLVPNSTNSAWGGSSTLANEFTSLGAFSLVSNSADDAELTTLPASNYSAQVSGVNNMTGVALVEIYDTEGATGASRLKNISARAQVGTDANILIAGFVISGITPKQVLIRGIGPALNTVFGLTGFLANPSLSIYDSTSSLLYTNTGWGGTATLSNAFASVGAFALPTGSADSALLVTLPPGAYSAQVSGVNRTTGVGLVEIYEMP